MAFARQASSRNITSKHQRILSIADVIKSLANKYQDELDELHCFLASPGESMKRKQKPPEKYYRDEAKSLSYTVKDVLDVKLMDFQEAAFDYLSRVIVTGDSDIFPLGANRISQ